MNNRRKMNSSDKRKYFLYQARNRDNSLYVIIITFILSIVFGLLFAFDILDVQPLIWSSAILICVLVYFLVVHVLFAFISMRKAEIVDGHVFKVHRGREYAQSSDTSIMATKARAISEDGNITTPWQYCSRRLMKEKNKPVFIVVNKKNQGAEFYY